LATVSEHQIDLDHAVGHAFTLAFTPSGTGHPSLAAVGLCPSAVIETSSPRATFLPGHTSAMPTWCTPLSCAQRRAHRR
jgi:hypothetical protein